MNKKQDPGPLGRKHLWLTAGSSLLLILILVFSWQTVLRTDRQMRDDLLQQARIIVQSVNIDRIRNLSGTKDDLNSPAYVRLKNQFAAIRAAAPQCRFIYLMGRKADGAVFFFVDSEPAGSADYSPPGEIYGDVPAGYVRVFNSRTAEVVGPVTDQWGQWISALMPIIDPRNDSVLAVMGMDVDARSWYREVAAKSAMPVGMMLALLGSAAVIAVARRLAGRDLPDRPAQPVLRNLPAPLIGVSLVILTVLAGGIQYYRVQKTAIRHDVEHQLSSIALLKANEIANWRTERLGDAGTLSGNRSLVRDLEQFLAAPQPGLENELRDTLRNFQQYYAYADILLVDTNGQVRLTLNAGPGDYSSLAAELTEALRNRKPVLTDFHTDASGAFRHLNIVAPLVANSDPTRAIGAIILSYDADRFYSLVQSWPVSSRSAETQLVRRDGPDVLFLNELRYRTGAALKLRIPLTHTNAPSVMAVLGHKGIMQGKDYRGVDVLSALQPVPDSPWFLVAKQDTAEVFADWRARSGAILILLFCLVGMAGAAGFIFWLRTQKNYYRTLHQSASARQKSEALLAATLRSIGDGVITCDASGCVTGLNIIAEKLTGWETGEAAGRPIAEVFRIIHAGTRQNAEIPVDRALRENRIIGLANHTALIARDGTELQIADSCAPIHDADGGVIGAVLVFRDVTEEYRQREQLRDNETLQRALLDNLPAGVVIIDPETRVIERVNSYVAELFGAPVDHLLGQRCHRLLCPADEGACPVCDMGKSVENAEREMLRADGSCLPILKTVKRIQLNGQEKLLECFVDISERKQMELYRDLENQILRILNEPYSRQETVQHVFALIKKTTGFEALGMRLKDGEDFPYFAQNGFSDDFLLKENSIIERDKNGELCRDCHGKVCLECTCGLVISGKADPNHPLFTKGGSFWINDSAPLLDLPADQDPRWNPHNYCIHTGYATIALIPIRMQNEIVGLLQINDRRKSRLSLTAVERFESIAAHIGEALMRKQAEEDVARNNARLQKLTDILQHPSDTIQEFLDYSLEQVIELTGSGIGYIYHYHEDRKEFVLNTWSKDVMPSCAVANPQTCYELDKTGIWGEAVRQRRPIIVNDFQATNSLKKGYPQGHVHLSNFMTVPVFRGEQIVGVVGLANKASA
ncbi:MAG TPA: GAF domain-containing protein, partial [Pontiellaceae bacterium]|nr:GAF domain-containing protein [Pontiellaceae bacterium]